MRRGTVARNPGLLEQQRQRCVVHQRRACRDTFHFIIYGELFGPDFEAFLDPASRAKVTSVSTRLDVTGRCLDHDHELAIAHVVNSSRWKSHWNEMRALAGPDFKENFFDEWRFSDDGPGDWRQRLWENVMLCQGFAGLEMLRPHLRSS